MLMEEIAPRYNRRATDLPYSEERRAAGPEYTERRTTDQGPPSGYRDRRLDMLDRRNVGQSTYIVGPDRGFVVHGITMSQAQGLFNSGPLADQNYREKFGIVTPDAVEDFPEHFGLHKTIFKTPQEFIKYIQTHY